MRGDRDTGHPPASVRRVFASVNLESTRLAEIERRARAGDKAVLLQFSGTSDRLNLHVSLSAEDSEGRRIASGGSDFGMSGPRRGIWHRWHGPPLPDDPEEADHLVLVEHRVDLYDIEDGINQMLGRDPALHRPPRLSWDGLMRALDEAGISVTEKDLIEAPLTIELDPEVRAELDRV